jgi:YfiH family protein
MNNSTQKYGVVEALEHIPSLVHGFGTRFWKEADLYSMPELANFHHMSLKQTHSDIIRVITKIPPETMEGDALVTDRPGILLIIRTADCLPALVVDTKNRAVAAVHCGWRGTLKGVIAKTLQTMHQIFGSDFVSLVVALGPCIDKACYEVGEDMREKFKSEGLPNGVFERHPSKKEKYVFDIRETNRIQILSLGVPEKNIVSVDLCTHCELDLFSYRRDRDHAGRLINFIGLSKSAELFTS